MTAITAATSAGRRALRRLLTPAAEDQFSRRAGAEPVTAAMVTPRTWIALA